MVTKTENGMQFPAEAYAYVPDPSQPSTWKVRLWETPSKKATPSQIGRAMASMGKGFRGEKADIPQAARAEVMAKVRAAWKSVHPGNAQKLMPTRLAEATAQDFQQIIELVSDAIDDALGVDSDVYAPGMGPYELEAIYADRVVIEKDGRYFEYPYTLDVSNEVQLGAVQEVVEQFVPVAGSTETPMSEAVSCFLEAKDATGSVWDAVLIRAGLSMNGVFYPDTVLREAAPLFEGARVFAKPDVEHIKGAGKDVNKLAGWITGPRFVEGRAPNTGQLVGTLHLGAGAGALRATLADAWQRGKRDLVGLSIDALGSAATEMRESKKVRVAKTITKVNSVDLIVEPSAGGGLVRLVEATAQEHQDMALKTRMLEAIKAKLPERYAQIRPETITDEELEALYREAVAPEAKATKEDKTPGDNQAITREDLRMIEARAYARSAIGNAKLPAPARERLLADWGKRERFAEAEVDAAIKAERDYLARFTESGKVVIDGEVQVEDRSKKIGGMLDAFFDPKHKDHRATMSFKEAYIEITGDKRVTGLIANMDKTRLAESLGAAFRESLDSTSFSNVLGDSITRRMIAEYADKSQYDAWRQIASVVPVADFRTQERTLYGGYGDLPTVNQGAPYTALGSPSDAAATYAAAKRGGTEDITLEMIKNDDVGAIRRIPVKLARSAKRTLGKFVFDFIRTNPNIYDGVALFHANHNNLGAAALDATSLGAARTAMLKQSELSSNEAMGIGPKSILVPVDLQEATWNLFQRGTNLDKTFVQSMLLDIIPVWYWTDTNDWAIAADPLDIPGIEVGFLDGQEEPELFVQDMPNVGSMFSNDKITYKIRHIYGGNVVPQGFAAFYKGVVA